MEDHVIETSIDKFIQFLKERGKMSISEAADFLKSTQKEVEPLLNTLEENGIIEIKYPVIGEPKIILKSTAPEKIEIKKPQISKVIEETETRTEVEKPKISERIELKPEVKGEETKDIIEKVDKLEIELTEISHEVDASALKEELEEVLLIIAGLRDVEKISFYLKEILGIIRKMKERGLWTEEDKDLVTTMLKGISSSWREFGEHEISELFEQVKKKIETA